MEALKARLSPPARELYAEIERRSAAAASDPSAKPFGVMPERIMRLSEGVRSYVQRLLDMKARAHLGENELLYKLRDRAVELSRVEGEPLDAEALTVAEALAILERHGEDLHSLIRTTPVFPDITYLPHALGRMEMRKISESEV